MTVDEFKDMINRRFVVECNSVSERNQTLELLIALGYEVNGPSIEYLEPGNQDFRYPHPVMERGDGGRICCTTTLIDYLDSSIDERSSEEFSEAFMALMS